MSLDAPGSRFILTDEMKYSPNVQISRKTGLVSDYANQYSGYYLQLFNYEEAAEYFPDNLPRLEAGIMASIREFKTYRAQYLPLKAQRLNALFFNGEMTPQDEEDMANDIFAGSSRSDALDKLSIAFKAELDTIKTAADFPRLKYIILEYPEKFRSLFSD